MKSLAAIAALAVSLFLPSTATASSADLAATLAKQAPGLRPQVLRLALEASERAAERGLVRRDDLLTVIDYSIPSTQPRLWVFDLERERLLFREHVAHGKNSGGNRPTKFSNASGSLQTSLGLFVTKGTYVGSNGYSLRLDGLERGVNDKAMERAIVMHGAPYVDGTMAKRQGRLGRSWGCPAVRDEIARKLIDTIKGGSPIFAYYPERRWLASSAFLTGGQVAAAGVLGGAR
ncbi:MAG: murein L,D-transpeptidase catalytic domain family protein [Thermoanaerobaculia bacterium]